MKTVLIAGGGTGGHLMPALAIASELRRQRSDLEPVLVGSERGVEARLLPTRDFRFHLLPSEPIYRKAWWKNLRWPMVSVRLLRGLRRVFAEEHPAAVVGTGGYASGPAVWLATWRGIPTAIQEQNAFPGLATRWLSSRVDQVYLGLPEARAALRFGPHTGVFVTGNPITPPDFTRRAAALRRFGLDGRGSVALITGGSQGALPINRAVAGWLDRGGGGGMAVLWATGTGSHAEFARYHRPPLVQVFDFLDPMADGYAVADLVVARAGMMTGAELCAWGLPSLLIPLPTAAADHQTHNAAALGAAGAAVVLEQSLLSPERLGDSVEALIRDKPRCTALAQAAKARGKPNAVGEIVSQVLTLVA